MSGFTTELQPAPCRHVHTHTHTQKFNAEACTLVSFFSACEASPQSVCTGEPNLLVLSLVNVLITKTEEDQIA